MLENVSMLQQNIVGLDRVGTIAKSADAAEVIEEEALFKLPDWELDFDELL
jgi:hypothetical protein